MCAVGGRQVREEEEQIGLESSESKVPLAQNLP